MITNLKPFSCCISFFSSNEVPEFTSFFIFLQYNEVAEMKSLESYFKRKICRDVLKSVPNKYFKQISVSVSEATYAKSHSLD